MNYYQRGVLGKNALHQLVASSRIIPCSGFDPSHIGPASMDLTFSGEIYRVDHLFSPSQLDGERVRELLPFMGASQVSLGDIAEVGETYIGPASVSVNFPPGLYGYLNAKSTSGRTFNLSRTIADGVYMFDSVDRRGQGLTGEIWIVLQPLTFPTVLTNKERYDQLRVFNGDTRFKSKEQLNRLLQTHDLLYRRKNQEPYEQASLSLFTDDGSVLCTLHARPGQIIGYRAKRTTKKFDLAARNLDPRDYYEPVYAQEKVVDGKRIWFVILEAGYYYLLSTNEMLKVPPGYAAELVALDPRLGLFFSHFAGFFDPGFFGTATLEVYAPITTVLRHKQPVARFQFEAVADGETAVYQGNYLEQIETGLPKQFCRWQ